MGSHYSVRVVHNPSSRFDRQFELTSRGKSLQFGAVAISFLSSTNVFRFPFLENVTTIKNEYIIITDFNRF